MPAKPPQFAVLTDGYEVASWSPGASDEQIPPTQVHLVIRLPKPSPSIVLRLKSKRACDELIATLIEHRDFTFGGMKQ